MKRFSMSSWIVVVGVVWFGGLAPSHAQVKANWWGAAPSQGREQGEVWKIASALPADALVAAVGTVEDGRAEYDKLLDITSAFARLDNHNRGGEREELLRLLKAWEAKSGVNLKEDLFASLRGAAGVFIRAPKIPANFADDQEAVEREVSRCWGLFVSVSDTARVEKVLRAVSADLGGIVSHGSGTTEFRLSPEKAPKLSLFVELGEGRLALGLNRDVARSLLSAGGIAGLAQQPAFASARARLEPGYRALLWVDGPGITAAISDMVWRSGNEKELAALMAFLKRQERSKIPLVVAFYPDGDALRAVSYGPDWDVNNWLAGMMVLNGLSW